ncbi:hypothetical protein [Streptomyces tropicalis]|uniref:Transposase DDE domain-containing protein n=1 Tax=Streptomyces tropicalis TaxID=3034234 RepID=A0ABT6A649_9ACTN|nr:hypothetical protein [Streptomyces tropicalis]MDF3300120.1 hypothetical protein [Streptomyces tropicalis]
MEMADPRGRPRPPGAGDVLGEPVAEVGQADQQDPDRRRLYGLHSGAKDSIEEFTDGHRGRGRHYRSLAKTHVQHALTALATNIERLSLQEPADGPYRPRPPTAFQQYLDTRGLRPLWWRQGK